MATLFVKRVGNTLVPDGDESHAVFAELPFGKTLKAEVKQSRNLAFHKLYFALCKRIGDGVGKNAEDISTVFKFATGHTETIRTKSYGDIQVPKSISFAKLSETEFKPFVERCIQTAYTEWKIAPEDLADLLAPQEDQKRGN